LNYFINLARKVVNDEKLTAFSSDVHNWWLFTWLCLSY